MSDRPSISELSLSFTGVFEAELLVELMLRAWKHPLAADATFRESLLESAADVLRASVAGTRVIDGVEPKNVNLVAAICVAESTTLTLDPAIPPEQRRGREAWIESVRRAVPSCFCDPDLLA